MFVLCELIGYLQYNQKAAFMNPWKYANVVVYKLQNVDVE